MPDVPQYFDVQVNGYGGHDFNSAELTPDNWHDACRRLRDDGMRGILATVITDELDAMAERLAKAVAMRKRDPLVRETVVGLHVEGPFVSAERGYVGTHPPTATRPADVDLMKRLLDAAEGLTRIVTLAPESDRDFAVTRYLVKQGITVSAGHCNPTIEQLRGAIDAGLTMFTHLGNGCPMQIHRHDNIIQRVLSCSDRLWISFIADGVHVPFFALKNYVRCAGIDRVVITTDAMAAAGLGPGSYRLGPLNIDVGEDLAAWAPDRSHLMGSAITMPRVVQNLREHVGLSDSQIKQVVFDNPRRAIHEHLSG
ncbi:MAG: N-acetylglucosamine-6-phosphate deacetylase [Pirellulales bacterium]|nr:N-acetylglucosamine-6-phosphate deacetylase [Pirellulales bacterium]